MFPPASDFMKSLYLFSLILSSHFIRLEPVKILLCGNLSPSLILIVSALHKHIIHHPDSQQIQIPDGNPQLHTPEKKQGSCPFTVCCMKFFLASTSVRKLLPDFWAIGIYWLFVLTVYNRVKIHHLPI